MISRGMYWDDFMAILRRNSSPWVNIKVYGPNFARWKINNMVTLADFTRPRRVEDDFIDTGMYEDDIMRESAICNGGWCNGSIPLITEQPKVYRNEQGEELLVKRPVYGIGYVVHELLCHGTIRPTKEIEAILRQCEIVRNVYDLMPITQFGRDMRTYVQL